MARNTTEIVRDLADKLDKSERQIWNIKRLGTKDRAEADAFAEAFETGPDKFFIRRPDADGRELVANVMALCSSQRYTFRDFIDDLGSRNLESEPEEIDSEVRKLRNRISHAFAFEPPGQGGDFESFEALSNFLHSMDTPEELRGAPALTLWRSFKLWRNDQLHSDVDWNIWQGA